MSKSEPQPLDIQLKAVRKAGEHGAVNGIRFEPTADQRDLVRVLASAANSQALIARLIGCSLNTLRKAFKDELRYGREHVDALVGAAVVRSALMGNVAAMRFYLLTHHVPGWEIPKTGNATGDATVLAAALAAGSDEDRDGMLPVIYRPTDPEEAEAESDAGLTIEAEAAE